MKKNSINIFAAFILAIFAGTIIYFGKTIHGEFTEGISRSEKLFSEIANYAENNTDKMSISMFENDSSVLSARFSLNGTKIIFAYPNEEISSHVTNSTLVKVFNKTIVKGDDVYELKMAIYLLRPEVIFNTSRTSFIIILVATLVSIAVLILISTKSHSFETTEKESSFNDKEELSEEMTEEAQDQEENTEEPVLDNNFQEESDEESEEKEEDTDPEDEISAVETPSENPYYNQQKVMDQATADEGSDFQKEELYHKVNFLLANAASNEQDLSLFLIKLDNTSAIETANQYLCDNYGKDNIYGYNENTLMLLKENSSIDEAEDIASLIEHNLKTILPEADCYIGISSRSIRMLSADRLIMEAEEALNHTSPDEDSHIIGFHVDIEKYREFLKNS